MKRGDTTQEIARVLRSPLTPSHSLFALITPLLGTRLGTLAEGRPESLSTVPTYVFGVALTTKGRQGTTNIHTKAPTIVLPEILINAPRQIHAPGHIPVAPVLLLRRKRVEQRGELFGGEASIVQNPAQGADLDCFPGVDGDGYSSVTVGMDKNNMTSVLAINDKASAFQCADDLIPGDPWKLHKAASTC